MSPIGNTFRRNSKPANTPRYYTLRQFREDGGPCRAQAYRLEAMGKLTLTRTIDGRVLVPAAEAARYFGEAAQ